MKILITGGAGFIGSRIVKKYIESGYEVAVIDNFSTGKRENVPAEALLYEGNICDARFVEKAMADFKPAIVSHHAARISIADSMSNPMADAEVNLGGAVTVLQAALKCKVQRFIFPSSAAVYGASDMPLNELSPVAPISPYGAAKLSFEQYLRVYAKQIEIVIFRYSNVYEYSKHGAGVFAKFYQAVIGNQPLVIRGDGSAIRDYVPVSHVVHANVLAVKKKNIGCETMNISSGVGTSTFQVMQKVLSSLGKETWPVKFEAPISGEVAYSVLDNSHAKETLGWCPQCKL